MHELNNQATTDLANISKQSSDTSAPSLAIGGGGQMIQHLDKQNNSLKDWLNNFDPEEENPQIPEEPKTEEQKPEEPKTSQGEYEQQLHELNKTKSDIETLYDWLNNGKPNMEHYNEDMKNLLKHYQTSPDIFINKEAMNKMLDSLRQKLAETNQNIFDIKYNPDFENRSYEDIRNDTAYQRAADDMAKAGLNRYNLTGGVNYGVSGGSSGKDEEEKRKKKKRERDEYTKLLRQQQIEKRNIDNANALKIMGMVGSLVAGTGLVGSSVYNNAQNRKQDFLKTNLEHARQDLRDKQKWEDMQAFEWYKKKIGHKSYK